MSSSRGEVALRLAALRDPSTDPERTFMTYAGTELTLIYDKGLEVPEFCAWYVTMRTPRELRDVFEPFVTLAKRCNCKEKVTLIMDAPTWRASPDYVAKSHYDFQEVIATSVSEQRKILDREVALLSAEIGPRGDGYDPRATRMTRQEARAYHAIQIAQLTKERVDMASALTFNSTDETVGVALAAKDYGLPLLVGVTLEKKDGKLPDGSDLRDLINAVDDATDSYPLCYIVNCYHPSHCDFDHYKSEPWFKRLRGIRGNASTLSHDELDSMTTLDAGDVDDFAHCMSSLKKDFPHFNLFGGCCGTDISHIQATLHKVLAS